MSDLPPASVGFRIRNSGSPLIRIVFGAAIIVCALLAILPITQWLSARGNQREVIRVDTASLPPPEPPPPEPPPPPEEEPEESEPELEDSPPPLDISQLEAMLNPGIGDAGQGWGEIGSWGEKPDAVADLQLFSIEDLDSRPRRLRAVAPDYPIDLRNQGIGGRVRLVVVIDEQGNVTVDKVLDGPHPTLIENARVAMSKWRFEPPKKDGKAVRARYIQNLDFDP